MCGRFALAPYEDLSLRLGVEDMPQPRPRYNIAPGQEVICVLPGGTHAMMFWGVRPYGRSLVNARAETLREKAMFSRLLDSGRCLVPATGFYEWDGQKRPYLFSLEDGSVFCMAALFTERREVMVITRAADEAVGKVHHRMPCILDQDSERLWTEGGLDEAMEALHDGPRLRMSAVSKAVNDPRNDGPELLEPLNTLDDWQGHP